MEVTIKCELQESRDLACSVHLSISSAQTSCGRERLLLWPTAPTFFHGLVTLLIKQKSLGLGFMVFNLLCSLLTKNELFKTKNAQITTPQSKKSHEHEQKEPWLTWNSRIPDHKIGAFGSCAHYLYKGHYFGELLFW